MFVTAFFLNFTSHQKFARHSCSHCMVITHLNCDAQNSYGLLFFAILKAGAYLYKYLCYKDLVGRLYMQYFQE